MPISKTDEKFEDLTKEFHL